MNNIKMIKFLATAVIFAVALAALGASAWAQSTYPTKTITIIVVVDPGGPADAIYRPLAESLTRVFGRQVIVQNKPGAGGEIGTAEVARATPDGYTLLMSHTAPFSIIPAMRAVAYDPLKDLTPITRIVVGPQTLFVRKNFPAKTLAEFVKYAKDNPGKVTFGSSGIGGPGQLAGLMLQGHAGIEMLYVPYTGFAPVITDLLGDRLDAQIGSISVAMPYIENGSLRAIASTDRSNLLPDVPPFSDTYPGLISGGSSYGLAAPAGTPPDVVRRLYEAVDRIARSPEFVKRYNSLGFNVVSSTPVEYAEFLKSEAASMAAAVKAAGLAK